MKIVRIIALVCVYLLITKSFGSDTMESSRQPSRKELVVEMSDLIKQYAFFHAGSAVFRYDSQVDTVGKIRLYVAQQVTANGNRAKPVWYYIDFTQPIKPSELNVVMGLNENYFIQPAKAITKKVGKDKNKKLFIRFFTEERKRSTDFGQLHDRLVTIVDQLTTP